MMRIIDRILWLIAFLGTCVIMINASVPPDGEHYAQGPMNTETFVVFGLYLLSLMYVLLTYERPEHLK